jgi:protein involved in polysaccharide export with SLBB domain
MADLFYKLGMRESMKRIIFCVVLMAAVLPGFAQDSETYIQFGDRPAQYILGGQDVLLITVNLWGHVQRPGIYSIPSTFGLVDLISSAGGPLKTARLSEVRIIRINQTVVTIDIDHFIKTGESTMLPILQPGDTIVVSGSVADIFTRIIAVLRDIAIILNVIYLAQLVD